jgi:hypothetical protein
LLACLAAAAFGLAGCSSDASTPELCDRACTAWDNCTGQQDFYPYDQCMSECAADGDWDSGYVECLERLTACIDMEQECG